jgi:magnesium transporter
MGEIVEGFDAAARERIAALRREGHFFWVDAALSDAGRDDLVATLGVPEHALGPLLDFRDDVRPSRKFHADGEHVVFAFSCFLETSESEGARAVEVHVLVSGDYVLTLHAEPVSLPEALALETPEGRSEQYFVYAILDSMVASGFDVLNQVELTLESLQLLSTDMSASRVRLRTLRALNSQLSGLRRRVAPQRGLFERVSQEIRRVEGLAGDDERYFERIGAQLNRLVDAIDAAANGMATLIDLRVNETIYWLTVLSTVFLPLTFVTGFFGMNFGWMVDHIDTPLAFVLLGIGGPIAGAAVTLWLVRLRGTPIDPDEHSRTRGRRPRSA